MEGRTTTVRGLSAAMSTALSLFLLFMCVMDGNQAFSFTSLSSFGMEQKGARKRSNSVVMGMGNSFGRLFRISTFGESHGGGVGVIVDGCPPRLHITREEIQKELDRRRPGQSRLTTPRNEADSVEILSGVSPDGLTLGTPIGMLVRNQDHRSNPLPPSLPSSLFLPLRFFWRSLSHCDDCQVRYGETPVMGKGYGPGEEAAT
ncbi:hypothetical protein NSK_006252 [Nannochloropsis salina CCMP1776]|uniref:chorismate synthase n=1 Tax=Nannochloropsis salina CCMP1776 TaxID=1027361 RepID=A0A4D9CU70_9STRA|nr:hypothetical protein NSK_006252 [Nannochloropsis salina CCMP1776]|eukprot:TFJ82426.1 hypothetical protein NSK_006252 [Nannochloropsis salina CCMP1776]